MNKKLIIGICAALIVVAVAVMAAVLVSSSALDGTAEERISGAEALVEEGKLAKAENTYKSVIEENAADKEAASGLADVYVQKGNYADAAEALKKAISYNPDDVALYDKLMGIYRESGETIEALQYIESIEDSKIRRKYLDAAYDRMSETPLAVGNTMGNLASGGTFAFYEDKIFYLSKEIMT